MQWASYYTTSAVVVAVRTRHRDREGGTCILSLLVLCFCVTPYLAYHIAENNNPTQMTRVVVFVYMYFCACPPALLQTAPLFECLVQHPEYYGPQLDSMKQRDAQPAAKEQQRQQQQQAPAKAAGGSSVGQQAAAAGSAGKLSAAAV
jgi:hypothetical protein